MQCSTCRWHVTHIDSSSTIYIYPCSYSASTRLWAQPLLSGSVLIAGADLTLRMQLVQRRQCTARM